MFETNFFLGLPLDQDFKYQLDQVPLPLRKLLIQENGDEYLQLIEVKGEVFLGKFLGELINTSSLELAYNHLVSLLKRLVPSYSYTSQNMTLLTLPVERG